MMDLKNAEEKRYDGEAKVVMMTKKNPNRSKKSKKRMKNANKIEILDDIVLHDVTNLEEPKENEEEKTDEDEEDDDIVKVKKPKKTNKKKDDANENFRSIA